MGILLLGRPSSRGDPVVVEVVVVGLVTVTGASRYLAIIDLALRPGVRLNGILYWGRPISCGDPVDIEVAVVEM